MQDGWHIDEDGRLVVADGSNIIIGDLDLEGTGCVELPDGLIVTGHMNVSGCEGLRLPDGLKVRSCLFLDDRVTVHMWDGWIMLHKTMLPETVVASLRGRTFREISVGVSGPVNLPIFDQPITEVHANTGSIVLMVEQPD